MDTMVTAADTAALQRAIERLFPPGVSAAVAAEDEAVPEILSEEAAGLGEGSVRRREFAVGRACARAALAGLGIAPCPIPIGADRAPVWPPSVVGSITHCKGLVAAVVAPRSIVQSLGLDAEPVNRKLRAGISRYILTPRERERAREAQAHPSEHADHTLLSFCAKESVYKCIAPAVRRRVGFHEIEVDFDPSTPAFSVGSPRDREFADYDVQKLRGRFTISSGFILASTYVESNP